MNTPSDKRPDIFISYASVDDPPLIGSTEGWVSLLVRDLRNLLGQKMIHTEQVSISCDEFDLHRSDTFVPNIPVRDVQSKLFILILSPGYLSSSWCMEEMQLFLQSIKGDVKKRIFVIERKKLNPDQTFPGEIADLNRYRLWYKNKQGHSQVMGISSPAPYNLEYARILDDIALDVNYRLRALKADTFTQKLVPKATVFLARVSDDIDCERQQVRRYLEQEQICVLPANPYQAGEAFKDMLKKSLWGCKLFIQLFGADAGNDLSMISQGYAKYQLEQAQRAGIPILQWVSPHLDVNILKSIEQQGLLHASSLIAEPLHGFKQRIVREALAQPKFNLKSKDTSSPVVFIHHEHHDFKLAKTIRHHIDKNMVAIFPTDRGKAKEIREDLEEKLIACDALVVVYGRVSLSWVEKQLLYYNKVKPRRKRMMAFVGVYDGPPKEKPTLNLRIPGLVILNCRQEFVREKLEYILKPIRQRKQQ